MIFVIMPLVQGTRQFLPRAAVYAASVVIGGSVFFAAAALLGIAIWRTSFAAALIGVFALTCVFHEVGLIRLPLPSRSWQVPSAWLRAGPFRSAVAYGVVMGLGFLTRAPFATYHAAVLWAFLSGSLVQGATVGAAFGLARAAALLLPRVVPTRDEGTREIAASEFLLRRASSVHLVNATALAVFAGALLAAAST